MYKSCNVCKKDDSLVFTMPSGVCIRYRFDWGFEAADRTVLQHCTVTRVFWNKSAETSKLLLWSMFISSFGSYFSEIQEAINNKDLAVLEFLNELAGYLGHSELRFKFSDLNIISCETAIDLPPYAYTEILGVTQLDKLYAKVGIREDGVDVFVNCRGALRVQSIDVNSYDFRNETKHGPYNMVVWLALYLCGIVLLNNVLVEDYLYEIDGEDKNLDIKGWASLVCRP